MGNKKIRVPSVVGQVSLIVRPPTFIFSDSKITHNAGRVRINVQTCGLDYHCDKNTVDCNISPTISTFSASAFPFMNCKTKHPMRRVTIYAGDGYRLSELFGEPTGTPMGTIVISAATGVRKEFYYDFSRYLIEQ